MYDQTKLPNDLFRVRVPTIATYTEEEIAIYGLPTEYDSEGDIKDTFGDMSVVELSINRIIDIYSMGYPLSIATPEDSKKLFTILENYLNAQVNQYTNSINQSFVRDERTNEIDKFLTEIFDYNRNTIVGDMIKNTGGGFALDLGMMNTGTLHTPTATLSDDSVQIDHATGTTGIMAGYTSQQQPLQPVQQQMQPMLQQNQPAININNIKRKSVIKLGSSITSGYMNDETFDI